MRLFVSIELPDKIKKYIKKIQKKIAQPGLRITKHPHITLKFIGDADVELVKKQLHSIKFNSFNLNLSTIGTFSRVIWIGLEPEHPVKDLAMQIQEKLGKDKFKPHITIARIKNKFTLPKIKVEPIKFKVENFKLMNSTLTPEGPIYEVLEEYQ